MAAFGTSQAIDRVDFSHVGVYKKLVRTLALDTSTSRGSVALRRDGTLVDAREGDPTRQHGVRLPGDLLALVAADQATLDDVTLLAVGLGPGAFTGLRVGLATIQGLAFATGLPVVGVSGFDALAVAAARSAAGSSGAIGIWLDGARGEVFAARYERAPAERFGVAAVGEALAAAPEAVIDAWREEGEWPKVWIGSGVTLYERVLRESAARPYRIVEPPLLAPLVAELAELSAAEGGAVAPHALRPVYVRRPDAELARQRATAPRVTR